jgi:DNA-binding transcriptional regulator YbjK
MSPVPSTPGESGRRPRTPSSHIERELIAAAEAVLIRDGPGAVTVRAVAAEAGIAPWACTTGWAARTGWSTPC